MLDDLAAEDLRPRTPFEDGVERRMRQMAAIDGINALRPMDDYTGLTGLQARLATRAPIWSQCRTMHVAEKPLVLVR